MDLVLTCLLTATVDPQRGVHLDSDVAVLSELRESLHRHGRALTVFHDCLNVTDEVDEFVRVPPGGNPYFYRWQLYANYLDHLPPGRSRVWCVDGTDVEMLHDPFPHMESDRFYSGSESRWPLGWVRKSCPSLRGWYDKAQDRPFLNMGVMGGTAGDVRRAARALAAAESDGDRWEIGAWQKIADDLFGDELVTGEPVHTVFTAGDCDHPAAWWRHK